jgi:thiamine biosynthesis lipoprotein
VQVLFNLIYLTAYVSAGPANKWQKVAVDSLTQYYRFCSVHPRIIAYNQLTKYEVCMDNYNSRRVALKFFFTACLMAAMYYFVMEKIRQPIEIDGGYREIMGTFARVVAVAKHERQARRCIEAGFSELVRIDKMMSDYKPDSELSKVNREAFANPVKVTPELFEILQKSVDFSRLSNGAFDITVGPLVDLWHKAGEANVMPDENTLAATKARVGYEKLILDANGRTVRFVVAGMRLDLGAIGKGYAVDKAVEAMQKRGAIGGMVDSGGNIRCFGVPADTDTWLVGLQNPKSAGTDTDLPELHGVIGTGEVLMVLKLNPDKIGMAVATSGDYRRFVTIDGKKVSHIVDPNTGASADRLSSDTIIAATAVDADGLSTAVNVMGAEKGLALVESLPGVEAILVTDGPEYAIRQTMGAEKYVK